MKQEIKRHMERMVDDYIYIEDLNAYLKAFIADKEQERGSWSEITVVTHYMLGGQSAHIDRMAAVTECVMLALDIVDDLQDQDHDTKPWMQCPQPVALNAILALLMGAIGELGQLELNPRLLVEMSTMITRSVNGQQKDVTHFVSSVDDYLLMTQEKSGSLFRFACLMGYASLDCTAETIETLHDLADCLGLIHQIENDRKDLVRWDLKNDLLSKKRTLPALYLLSIEDDAFRLFQDYYAGSITVDDLLTQKEQLLHMIHTSGCIEYSQVVQSVCLQKAEALCEQLEAASPWKETFKEITFGSYLSEQFR
ncbi:polyprenyl synthetase family protein [Paenibacillus sp. SYP-B4298]|uniref:polyprenyl synthetase family protein n=1 Tax=Paenibacillus sp. SYP-B4298 TaxID=2996034 RepID=UPI0022DDF10E|nr:polyprenyl synthetase family protein [Paenibacillus sp. SYP-B4298]